MTKNSDFKHRVRARMAATGENYTKARDAMLSAPATSPDDAAALAFYDKTVRTFFGGERLRSIPAKRKTRVVVLLELLDRFEGGRTYDEAEVNAILRTAHDDVAYLRRELVEYQYLSRADGRYRVTEALPERDGPHAQEVPDDEATRLPTAPPGDL